MKFIKISLLSLLLISTSAVAQQFAATGMHAGFGVNSVNPVATFQNVSKYMESADFKKLGITAGLYANNVNGADDTTHSIEFYYPDAAAYQKAVDLAATSPAVADLIFDTVGLEISRQQAIFTITPGGTIIHVGLTQPSGTFNFRKLTIQEVTVVGTYCYTNSDFVHSIDILEKKVLGSLNWIEYRDLKVGAEAFKQIHDGTCVAPKIILIP